MNTIKVIKKQYAGFTLVEMLIVLFVISVLVLLFVPSLTNQRSRITESGNQAFIQVVQTQVELYQMNEDQPVTYSNLVANNYLSQEQADRAVELNLDLNDLP
ncbi:competence type IV pilus major pilin ComGC [Vagococcus salmoninarum]|uniref:competence type IV pilus major pilin ComGC n=1 Tax=Vagococcus salmoninarum TaxID=2739 RepID=UPI0018814560|nr:competence type IV pilus major pilin ComGC [Vagococcus salmoninarum]MBE9389176.1 prepilin-type N-terminal cleavage/methylation domain-containing protein [Vagococcus salmoninarum]